MASSSPSKRPQPLTVTSTNQPRNVLPWTTSSNNVAKLNIQRLFKTEELLEEYHGMQTSGKFTDLDLVTGDRKRISVHSLVVAASSHFIKYWMESTLVPDMKVREKLNDKIWA